MTSLWDELSWRNSLHQTTADDVLPAKLANDRLTLYCGFDPTARSLQLGNLAPIVVLMRFQQAGHRPIALAGGGTGMVGDPGGRSSERNLLTSDELGENLAGIRKQLERFLDFGSGGALLVDNGEWLWKVGLLEFLRDVGKHFTVNQMVAKDSVRTRLESDNGISYTEFSYQLLQAYDFLRLHDELGCDLQVGASDQWGNITAGVELIRRVRNHQAFGLTFPLLLDDQGRKMGKSAGGDTIWLDPEMTSPYAFFQMLVRTDDRVVGSYLRALTFLDRDAVEALDSATVERPERREAQRALAREVTTLVHGATEAERAERAAAVLFTEEIASLDERTLLDVLGDAPSSQLASGTSIVDALTTTGLCASKGDARRQISGGGVSVNNRKVADEAAVLDRAAALHGRWIVLRRGKKDHHLVELTG